MKLPVFDCLSPMKMAISYVSPYLIANLSPLWRDQLTQTCDGCFYRKLPKGWFKIWCFCFLPCLNLSELAAMGRTGFGPYGHMPGTMPSWDFSLCFPPAVWPPSLFLPGPSLSFFPVLLPPSQPVLGTPWTTLPPPPPTGLLQPHRAGRRSRVQARGRGCPWSRHWEPLPMQSANPRCAGSSWCPATSGLDAAGETAGPRWRVSAPGWHI